MKMLFRIVLVFILLIEFTNAFSFSKINKVDPAKISDAISQSRRDAFETLFVVLTGVTTTTGVMTSITPAASASGGATAGGAYLLSAKQRYNQRVRSALQAFVNLRSSVEEGRWVDIEAYFVTTDVGGWNDVSTAGYLLANAFRRNSSAAPDTLPSVKVCVMKHLTM
jgi:hypothetical protein